MFSSSLRPRSTPILSLLLMMLVSSHAIGTGTLSVSWDNDLLTGKDKGYTNGLRISYLEEAAEQQTDCGLCLSRYGRDHLQLLPGIGGAQSHHALAWSLRQLMITPQAIQAQQPQYNDIPYTGYLTGQVTLWSWTGRSITGYGLSAGVVGPESMAEEAQKAVHSLTGSTDPKGWDNQLGTDRTGGLQIQHAHRAFQAGSQDELQHQVSWLASARANSFVSNAQFGTGWHFGQNLPSNFISDYAVLSSSVGMPGILNAPGPGWSVFAGIMGEWVPYSYLEERSGRYQYDQAPVVGHAGVGASWHTQDVHLSVSLRTTTSQDATNKEPLSFGTVSLVWRL